MATPPDFTAGQVLTAAQMNQVGLWLIASQTFSAATSVAFNNVFSTDYEEYSLVVRYSTSSTNAVLYQNRLGTTDAASNYNNQLLIIDGTSVTAARSTGQTSLSLGSSTDGILGIATMRISGPFLAAPTLFEIATTRPVTVYTSVRGVNNMGNHSTATSYDGFRLFTSTGTITGTATLYGYNI
jgi:hypothetical protein